MEKLLNFNCRKKITSNNKGENLLELFLGNRKMF